MKKISIKKHALGFFLVFIFVFFLSSLLGLNEIQRLDEKIIKNNLRLGKIELTTAIKELVHNQNKIAEEFSSRDEVHQQLNNPEYYHYWETHRLYSAEILPEHIVEASVYNKQGENLGQSNRGTLPDKISHDNTAPYFLINNYIPFLVIISAISDDDNKNEALGYIAIKINVLTKAFKFTQFHHIERASIQSLIANKKQIKVERFINYLNYNIKKSNDSNLFTKQLNRIIFRNLIIITLFALFFYYLMSRFLSNPLTRMSHYIDTLNNNSEFQNDQELSISFNISELEKVKQSLTLYHHKLKTMYTNLDDKNQDLWKMAHHDALTGVLNRRAFEEQWNKISELFSKKQCHISLILFDINHFKSINDSYGHPIGDKVLRKTANILQKVLGEEELLYRIGGDEFAAILYDRTPEDATFIANQCQKAINHISFIELDIVEPVRISIGVTHCDSNFQNSISDLLWQADIAVYTAKKPGQSHIVTYSDEIKNNSSSILSSKMYNIVFKAIETGDNISIFYQPIINLENSQAEYYEALLRIKNNDEIISPWEVFQLIEARKLDYDLDIMIFKHIAGDLKRGIIPLDSGVSINISGPSIINPKIVNQLSMFVPFLEHYKIVLEITETSLITNIDHATDNIIQLKKYGFLIALDDFGSGYSSISYLSKMPVDIVKFDITLIKQLEDKKQFSIISHLAQMIMETGHLLVAEGIETETLKEQIKKLGFNYAQGYLYGRPAPIIKN